MDIMLSQPSRNIALPICVSDHSVSACRSILFFQLALVDSSSQHAVFDIVLTYIFSFK